MTRTNCPVCDSSDIKTAIHTDYQECNNCFNFWEAIVSDLISEIKDVYAKLGDLNKKTL